MGRGLLDGFAIEMLAMGAPRVIGGGRWFGELELVVEGFAVHHFTLAGWLVVNGIGQGVSL